MSAIRHAQACAAFIAEITAELVHHRIGPPTRPGVDRTRLAWCVAYQMLCEAQPLARVSECAARADAVIVDHGVRGLADLEAYLAGGARADYRFVPCPYCGGSGADPEPSAGKELGRRTSARAPENRRPCPVCEGADFQPASWGAARVQSADALLADALRNTRGRLLRSRIRRSAAQLLGALPRWPSLMAVPREGFAGPAWLAGLVGAAVWVLSPPAGPGIGPALSGEARAVAAATAAAMAGLVVQLARRYAASGSRGPWGVRREGDPADERRVLEWLAEHRGGVFAAEIGRATRIPQRRLGPLLDRLEDESRVTVTRIWPGFAAAVHCLYHLPGRGVADAAGSTDWDRVAVFAVLARQRALLDGADSEVVLDRLQRVHVDEAVHDLLGALGWALARRVTDTRFSPATVRQAADRIREAACLLDSGRECPATDVRRSGELSVRAALDVHEHGQRPVAETPAETRGGPSRWPVNDPWRGSR